LIARLKRDHPDIAKRLASGEFRSLKEAAKVAGIDWVREPPNPVHHLRHWWRKANQAQRQTFLAEIGAVMK
jgi:hypothetical protein